MLGCPSIPLLTFFLEFHPTLKRTGHWNIMKMTYQELLDVTHFQTKMTKPFGTSEYHQTLGDGWAGGHLSTFRATAMSILPNFGNLQHFYCFFGIFGSFNSWGRFSDPKRPKNGQELPQSHPHSLGHHLGLWCHPRDGLCWNVRLEMIPKSAETNSDLGIAHFGKPAYVCMYYYKYICIYI